MKSALSQLSFARPRTLEEALTLLRDEPLVPIAGATDLYVGLNFGTLKAQRFLDITRLEELRGISVTGDRLVIGAGTTYTTIMHSASVPSPAGDTLPVLAVADAILQLRSAQSQRAVPFNSFYTGYRQTVLRPDELIVSIELPMVEGKQWFRKVGTRAAQAISKLVMAAVRTEAPRIALGSVAPTPLRLRRTEAALAGGSSIEDAIGVLQTEITPIDDLRSSEAYRRAVAGNLLRRFWAS